MNCPARTRVPNVSASQRSRTRTSVTTRAVGIFGVFGLAAAVFLSGVGTPTPASAVANPSAAVTTRVPPWPTALPGLPAFLSVPATRSTATMKSILRTKIPKRLRWRALGKKVSIRVEDLETGAKEFGAKSGRGMIPASTMKTVTALAALSALGADYRSPTNVRGTSDNLIVTLTGGGDPLLSSWDLNRLARKTADKLLSQTLPGKKIQILFDDSIFATPSLAPGWPASYFSQYVTAPRGLTRDLRRYSDGARDAARYFRSKLVAHGLKGAVKKAVHRGTAPAGSELLAKFKGHALGDAVWPMLRYSDNSIAENLIRHVAIARGNPTTPAGAAQAVTAELRKLGVPMRGARIVDGSGLSTINRLSTRTLIGVVRASMDPENLDLSIGYRSLGMPIAGQSGTLYSRFRAKKAKCAIGRVMAKTGTLTGVNALSGVAAGDDGRTRAFSILVNNRPLKVPSSKTLYRIDRLAAAVTGCG